MNKLVDYNKEIKKYRTLLLITVIAYPLIGYMNTMINNTESISHLFQRITFSLLIITALILQYKNKFIFEKFYQVISTFEYIGFSHLFILVL